VLALPYFYLVAHQNLSFDKTLQRLRVAVARTNKMTFTIVDLEKCIDKHDSLLWLGTPPQGSALLDNFSLLGQVASWRRGR